MTGLSLGETIVELFCEFVLVAVLAIRWAYVITREPPP